MPRSQVRLGTFHAACWMLALVAFVELVAVGVALALRNQAGSEPLIVERVVTEYVPLAVQPAPVAVAPAPEPEPVASAEPAVRKAITTEAEIMAIPASPESTTPLLEAPFIADPVVERLVSEAREARVRGDIRGAITKLEDAEQRSPDEPTVLYQSAEVFEAMGHYERAADYYEKVWAVGPKVAGRLHELAGLKLSHGFENAQKMEGKLTLGRIRQFPDKRVPEGERIILTIPIMAAPGQKIDADLLTVDVIFFDKLDDKIHEASPASTRESRWLTEPLDWKDTGEELLQVTYFIPPGDARDRHLLGERKYCGYIVELHYEEELLDHQAWPRTLAIQRNVPESDPIFIPDDFPVEDWNPGNPLLPPLPK